MSLPYADGRHPCLRPNEMVLETEASLSVESIRAIAYPPSEIDRIRGPRRVLR